MTADERKRHGLAWLRRAEKNHRSATQGVFPEDTCFFAEWPNGVDELVPADKSRTRKWPDGRVENLEPGDPAGKAYPNVKAHSHTLAR